MTTRIIQRSPTVVQDDPVVYQDSGGSLTTVMLVTLVSLVLVAIAVLLILHFTVGVA